MERYSGDGDKLPPCIEMTLCVPPNMSTKPCDLTLPVTLVGVRQPNNKLDIIRPLDGTCYIVYFILHVIMPRWAEPRRHTVVVVCVSHSA